MKTILVLLLILMAPSVSQMAQDSTKQATPTLSKPIATLSKANGFYFDKETNKWNITANKIEGIEPIDQFTRFEFRIAENNGRKYLILRKDYEIGHYHYPIAKKEWKGHKAYVDWVIDFATYKQKIDSLNAERNVLIFDVPSYSFDVASEGETIPKIDFSQKEEKHKLIIKFRTDTIKQRTRFFIYSRNVIGENFFNIKHLANNRTYNSYSPEGEIISSDKLYSNFFFETDMKSFMNFIKAPLKK